MDGRRVGCGDAAGEGEEVFEGCGRGGGCKDGEEGEDEEVEGWCEGLLGGVSCDGCVEGVAEEGD